MDYTINEKMHAFERFSRFWDTLSGAVMFGAAGGPGFGINNYGGNSNGANDSLASGMDIAISPKLLTDFRLGYYRYNVIDTKHDQGTEFANTLGIPGINIGGNITSGAPGFNITNVPGGGGGTNGTVYGDGLNVNRCNCPLTEREDQFQIVNNWTQIMRQPLFQGGRRPSLWPQPARAFRQRSRRLAELRHRSDRRSGTSQPRAASASRPSCSAM